MSLTEQLDRLAAFDPAPYPVVSLYLNTQPIDSISTPFAFVPARSLDGPVPLLCRVDR